MHITLIDITNHDTSAIGARSLSAYLKRAGHHVRLIFLVNAGAKTAAGHKLCPEYVVEQVEELCRSSHLVGLSFLTSGFHRAAQLTERLKRTLSVPFVWGGIHATSEPEHCLKFADIIVLGEGEEATLELVECLEAGQDFRDVPNLCFKKDGRIIKNPMRPLIPHLDEMPFIDYEVGADHFVLVENQKGFRSLDKSLLLQFITPIRPRLDMGEKAIYTTMASRGCIHRCNYCFHSVYHAMYPKQKYYRKRSPENIVNELSQFIQAYDFQGIIWFADDCFTTPSTQDIFKFSELYKEKIGLPFFCLGSPTTLREKKLRYLTEAGLQYFEYGIQTGSQRTKKVFNRPFSREQIINECKLINTFKDKIALPFYDFILDNPWENVEDQLETLDLIMQIPKPYHLALASFRYFPGSCIYEEAKKQGIISAESKEIYVGEFTQLHSSYLNFLIILHGNYNVPQKVVKFLSDPKLIKIFNKKIFQHFYAVVVKLAHLKGSLPFLLKKLLSRKGGTREGG